MTDLCARWMELSDKQLLGEELSELELRQIRAHELDCEQCGREAAIFRELRTAPLHLVPSEEEVQRILLRAELSQADDFLGTERRAPRRRLPTSSIAVAVSVLALAAGVWLYLRTVRSTEPATQGATAALPASSASHAAAPRPTNSSAARAQFAGPVAQDTCGSLGDGIVLCLVAGSEVGEIQLEGSRRTVELKSGRAVASLEPQPPGTSFSITTVAGKVTAVGTIFSVQIGRESDVYASVTRGKVMVLGVRLDAPIPLSDGHMVRLGDSEVSVLPALEAQQDLDLVASWAVGSTETDHGEPHSALDRAEPRFPEARASGAGGSYPQAKDELGYARSLRMHGQFARAAAVYRSVYSHSPRSESGRAALMSLAGLQLSSLGDASGALASYEAYLAGGGGPLSEQAAYGRIRALHQLGDRTAEREATRKFIARYPNAPETRLLKERDSVPDRR
jgi:hypothetical protein